MPDGAAAAGLAAAMANRRLLGALALIVALPVLVAALGTSRYAGALIGVVLVLVGAGMMLLSSRREG